MIFSSLLDQQARQSQTPLSIHQNTQQDLGPLQPLPKSKKNARLNPFAWKGAESKQYISFLKKNIHLMSLSVQERKRIRINVIMSQYVKSKNPEQCRSHHQKMMLKYGSVQGIIDSHAPKKPASKMVQRPRIIQWEKTVGMCQYKMRCTEQPLWHQYLALNSQEESRDCVPNEEMLL